MLPQNCDPTFRRTWSSPLPQLALPATGCQQLRGKHAQVSILTNLTPDNIDFACCIIQNIYRYDQSASEANGESEIVHMTVQPPIRHFVVADDAILVRGQRRVSQEEGHDQEESGNRLVAM